jgi:hypothetical protein
MIVFLSFSLCRQRVFISSLGAAVFFEQQVGHLELGAGHCGERHLCLLTVLELDLHGVAREAQQGTLEATPAVDRLGNLDLREVAGPTLVVLRPGERPVDAGRAHFERVGAGNRILDVEHRGERARKRGAVLDIHRPPVGRLDHDLQRAALAHGDAHQFVAHADDGRGHDVFDAAQQFGHSGPFVRSRSQRQAQKKRAGVRPTLFIWSVPRTR